MLVNSEGRITPAERDRRKAIKADIEAARKLLASSGDKPMPGTGPRIAG